MTKQIQSMPDIWNSDKMFLTSKEDVLGALANWAIQQSPYVMPEDLDVGLREFWMQFDPCPPFEYFETNCNSLRSKVRDTFESCPTIMGWNVAKKGSGTVICSRYDSPEPDYDIIDLDALARNVAHSITLEAKYSQLHD